jgi:parallel beta-helix repeat protein
MKTQDRVKLVGAWVVILAAAGSVDAATYGKGEFAYDTWNIKSPTVYSTVYTPSAKTGAAIQDAIDDAHNAGGGTVQLSSGYYWISSPIEPKSKVKVIGAGKTATILKRLSSATPAAIFWSENDAVSDFYLSDMTIHGNYTTTDLANGVGVIDGIYMSSNQTDKYNYRIRLENLKIVRCKNGVIGGGIKDLRVQYCDLYQNGSSNLHHNFYMRRVGSVYFYKCNITEAILGTGIKIWGGTEAISGESQNFIMNYNDISDNYKRNLELNGVGYAAISNNTIDNNTAGVAGMFMGYGYDLSGNLIGSHYSDLVNNKVQSNDGYGIYLEYGNRVNIQGNYSVSNGDGNYYVTDSNRVTCDYNTSL